MPNPRPIIIGSLRYLKHATLQKKGGSVAMLIPPEYLEKYDLQDGNVVVVYEEKNGSLVMIPMLPGDASQKMLNAYSNPQEEKKPTA